MLTQRTKLIVIVGLSLCLVAMAYAFGFTRITPFLNIMEVGSSGQAPVRRLRIILEESQREQLFDRFRKFADKHGFQFHISDYGTGGEDYLIEMSRNDMTIDASIIHADSKMFPLDFMRNIPDIKWMKRPLMIC